MSLYSEFAHWYEQIFPFREEVYRFLGEYAGVAGSRVLDAGCGPGHYCSRFQRDGFHATGIDSDPVMIATAVATFPAADFHCMDIVGLSGLQQSFRLIYSIGNVLAHLPPHRLSAFLQQVHDVLEPGGFWIMQVVNWDYLIGLKEYTFPVKRVDDGSVMFHRRYSALSPERAVFEVELVSDSKTVFHEETTLYPFTSKAALQQHGTAGFSPAGMYAGFDKTTFSREINSGLVMAFTK